jgi:beta-glucosidase-like glycosyl hydrolase
MVMQGVQKYESIDACIMAIKAGVDMFIFRESNKEVLDLIEKLNHLVKQDDELKSKITESHERIIKLKQRCKII